jgi:hypothetical protein
VSTQLVHLVRAANGIEPFRRFLDAYRARPAGAPHRLVLLCKGFSAKSQATPYLELAAAFDPRPVFVDDRVLDLGAYHAAASELDEGPCCFLNSYSEPLVAGWLASLVAALADPAVALVGVGGSCESAYSASPPWLKPRRRRAFDPFPNPHLRTNGFMIERGLLLALEWPEVRSKAAALALESGKRSLARQVWERGFDVVVVGRDEVAYRAERWRESGTFRSLGQRNLLIADNRTRQYHHADARLRERLERMAWGDGQDSLPGWAAPASRATRR